MNGQSWIFVYLYICILIILIASNIIFKQYNLLYILASVLGLRFKSEYSVYSSNWKI